MQEFILFILLFAIPFIFQLFLINAAEADCISGSPVIKIISNIFAEQTIDKQVDIVFSGKIDLLHFYVIRLLTCIFFGLVLFSISSAALLSIVEILALYKSFYYFLKVQYTLKINKMSNEMPYFIKNVIYLSYDNPVAVAIAKAILYTDESIKIDLEILVENIAVQPNSYLPYQQYIDKYDNKIKHLDYYFRSLYRISESSNEDNKLLDSLNKTVSDDLNIVRVQKNKIINDVIGYLGLIPVIIMVIFLTAMLVITINYM